MARVLIVDDDEPTRNLLTRLLRREGHEVVAASDGLDGLERARAAPPALVISDLVMPRMDGYELARALRAETALARTPLVLFSGVIEAPDAGRMADDLGLCRFLPKPSRPLDILRVVRESLGLAPPGPLDAPGPVDAPRPAADFDRERLRILSETLARKVDELSEALRVQDLANILVVDLEHRIVRWNAGCERLYGHAAEDVLGRLAGEVLRTEYPRPPEELRAAVLAGGRWEGELRHRRADGTPLIVHNQWVLHRDSGGGPALILEVHTDVSRLHAVERDLRRREAELRELTQTLEERVAQRTVEADRRTAQLRALSAELTLAAQRERKRIAQVLHDHLQQLLVAARFRVRTAGRMVQRTDAAEQLAQLDRLIGETIDVARTLSVDLSPPVLHDRGLVPALEWLARDLLEKHRLAVTLEAPEDLGPMDEVVAVELFQVARELLFNVVKHARVPHARLTVTRQEGALCVAVEDEGPGFPPPAADDGPCGSGLLHLRHRLELLDGRLDVDAQRPRGARVAATIPLPGDPPGAPGAAGPAPARTPADAPAGAAPDAPAEPPRIRVLLADDHELVRDGLATLLDAEPDIEIVGQAADGRAAVELAAALRPDVVIMDLSMPVMDGVEATRRVVSAPQPPSVIGLSMYEPADAEQAMRAAGAVAFLSKASAGAALVGCVRRCARRGGAPDS